MTSTPALLASIGLAWVALSVPVALLLGRAIRLADSRCPCGGCGR